MSAGDVNQAALVHRLARQGDLQSPSAPLCAALIVGGMLVGCLGSLISLGRSRV